MKHVLIHKDCGFAGCSYEDVKAKGGVLICLDDVQWVRMPSRALIRSGHISLITAEEALQLSKASVEAAPVAVEAAPVEEVKEETEVIKPKRRGRPRKKKEQE